MNIELAVVILVWSLLTGLVFGSFLNVVILRLPQKNASIVHPRSHCTVCGSSIWWYDNLPILSFIRLGGRCRFCGSTNSIRYPVIEALTGLGFLAAFALELWVWDPSPGLTADLDAWVRAVTGAVLFFVLLGTTMIDIDRRIIPDEFSLPGIAAGVVLATVFPAAFAENGIVLFRSSFVDGGANALLGAAVGGGVIFAVGWFFKVLLGKEAMGFGDVKLLAMLGAFLGWDGALLTLVLASVLGSIFGTVYYIVKRDRYIPFGPFLAAGGMSLYWFKPQVVHFFTVTYPRWLGGIS